jgi:hypothetical protein
LCSFLTPFAIWNGILRISDLFLTSVNQEDKPSLSLAYHYPLKTD